MARRTRRNPDPVSQVLELGIVGAGLFIGYQFYKRNKAGTGASQLINLGNGLVAFTGPNGQVSGYGDLGTSPTLAAAGSGGL